MTKATFPEVREALKRVDDFRGDIVSQEFDDMARCLSLRTAQFAPAMLVHIDAQAAEIERLHAGIANSHKGIAARDAALTKYEADDVRYLRNMAEKDAEIERLREALLGLKHAGALLSNIAFNLSQHPGRVITADEAADMDKSRKAWDIAARAALEQTK